VRYCGPAERLRASAQTVHEPADSPQHAPNELVASPSRPDEMRETLEVRVFGPQLLTGGSELSLSIEVSTTAFLVVYSVDELGRGGLLWPKPTDPELVARPAQPVSLPRGRQDMLTVVAGTRSLEDSVIACGFVDRAAKDAFRRRLSVQGSRVPSNPAALLDGLSGSFGCGRLDYVILPGNPGSPTRGGHATACGAAVPAAVRRLRDAPHTPPSRATRLEDPHRTRRRRPTRPTSWPTLATAHATWTSLRERVLAQRPLSAARGVLGGRLLAGPFDTLKRSQILDQAASSSRRSTNSRVPVCPHGCTDWRRHARSAGRPQPSATGAAVLQRTAETVGYDQLPRPSFHLGDRNVAPRTGTSKTLPSRSRSRSDIEAQALLAKLSRQDELRIRLRPDRPRLRLDPSGSPNTAEAIECALAIGAFSALNEKPLESSAARKLREFCRADAARPPPTQNTACCGRYAR
jgi:hypothetical protein